MSEEEKINEVLEKHSRYFQTTTADVAKSIKGKHLFFLVDSQNGEFYQFKVFSTAEELEQIILYEMADDANLALEVGIENLNVALNEHPVSYLECDDYGGAIEHLADSLDAVIEESNRWRDKLCNSLNSLMAYTDKNRKGQR